MIVGNPSVLAIESEITQAYGELGRRALGFFVIHVDGRAYGVRSPDASMLGCSFNEVEGRIKNRGGHVVPFAEFEAEKIAAAFRRAIYADDVRDTDHFFGLRTADFAEAIYSKRIQWAPDGDEAFDDGAHVLQFDVKDRVRVIAFRSSGKGFDHNTLA